MACLGQPGLYFEFRSPTGRYVLSLACRQLHLNLLKCSSLSAARTDMVWFLEWLTLLNQFIVAFGRDDGGRVPPGFAGFMLAQGDAVIRARPSRSSLLGAVDAPVAEAAMAAVRAQLEGAAAPSPSPVPGSAVPLGQGVAASGPASGAGADPGAGGGAASGAGSAAGPFEAVPWEDLMTAGAAELGPSLSTSSFAPKAEAWNPLLVQGAVRLLLLRDIGDSYLIRALAGPMDRPALQRLRAAPEADPKAAAAAVERVGILLRFCGSAWPSAWATLQLAALAATRSEATFSSADAGALRLLGVLSSFLARESLPDAGSRPAAASHPSAPASGAGGALHPGSSVLASAPASPQAAVRAADFLRLTADDVTHWGTQVMRVLLGGFVAEKVVSGRVDEVTDRLLLALVSVCGKPAPGVRHSVHGLEPGKTALAALVKACKAVDQARPAAGAPRLLGGEAYPPAWVLVAALQTTSMWCGLVRAAAMLRSRGLPLSELEAGASALVTAGGGGAGGSDRAWEELTALVCERGPKGAGAHAAGDLFLAAWHELVVASGIVCPTLQWQVDASGPSWLALAREWAKGRSGSAVAPETDSTRRLLFPAHGLGRAKPADVDPPSMGALGRVQWRVHAHLARRPYPKTGLWDIAFSGVALQSSS